MARDGRWALNIVDARTGNTAWNNILLNDNPSRGSITVGAESLSAFRSDNNIVCDRFSADGGNQVVSLERWTNGTGLDHHSRTATSRELFKNAMPRISTSGHFHRRLTWRTHHSHPPRISMVSGGQLARHRTSGPSKRPTSRRRITASAAVTLLHIYQSHCIKHLAIVCLLWGTAV